MSGTSDPTARLDGFIGELTGQGYLTDPAWRAALRDIPRHLFIPDAAWATPDDGTAAPHPIDRKLDEPSWLNAVYSDTGIVTQIDDGVTDPATGDGSYTSSASAPAVVCQFIDLLEAGPGHRVLEIGTGTGWTSALLAHRVGHLNVITVEIDAQVAAQARTNLSRAVGHAGGAMPIAVIGDGAHGASTWAPYDRVHVTCGVRAIPYAWVEQTRPGGVIVLPYQPGYGYGHKLRLEVAGDGTAVGRFHGAAFYMMMRSQRPREGTLASFLHHEDDADHTTTTIDPRALADAGPGADLAISALAPGVRFHLGHADDDSGEATLWLTETTPAAPTQGSWALAEYVPGYDHYQVKQYGLRRLWDEVSSAYRTWISWGRPAPDRFSLRVTAQSQHLSLDGSGDAISNMVRGRAGF